MLEVKKIIIIVDYLAASLRRLESLVGTVRKECQKEQRGSYAETRTSSGLQ